MFPKYIFNWSILIVGLVRGFNKFMEEPLVGFGRKMIVYELLPHQRSSFSGLLWIKKELNKFIQIQTLLE